MSKKAFDEFINKQVREKYDSKPVDWNARRDEWLDDLAKFYQKVEGFLAEYVKEKKLAINYTEETIFEEYIGSYSARTLNIELGHHKLRLEPVGTIIIGARGRVDLIGANGTVKFVLVNKQSSGPKIKVDVWIEGEEPPEKSDGSEVIEWEWKIATPPPNIKYINLEQDTFLEALMEVIGG